MFKAARSFAALTTLAVASWLTLSCGNSSQETSVCSGCLFLYATTNSGQILTFPLSTSGTLGTPVSTAGPSNSTGIVGSATGGALQAGIYVSDPENSSIRAYVVRTSDGTLSPASFGPYAVSSSPGQLIVFGTTLYVASPAGNIFALTINSDRSLSSVSGSPFAAGAGVSHLMVAPSEVVPNTTFLYAANSNDANGSISAFTIAANGGLMPVSGSPFATVPNGGPEGFYDGGNVLYVALKNANGVAALAINSDGSLTPIAGSPFAAGRGTSSLAGADGFIFAMNNQDGTISSYSMDPFSGILTQVSGSPFTAVLTSGDLLYENGKLFVPNASSNNISGFAPDFSSGAITSLNGSPFPAGAGTVALTFGGFPEIDPPRLQ